MWTPDPAQLGELRKIFKATLSSSHAERSAANDFLAHARTQPEFQNYLCHLLVEDNGPADVRAAAGLNLKNSAKRQHPPPDVLAAILHGLTLADQIVRNITGTVITAFFATCGIEGWPDVLPQLLALSQNDASVAREAAVSTVAKICEDSGPALDREYAGERPLDHVVAAMVAVARLPLASLRTRVDSVLCLNSLVPLKSQLVFAAFDAYLAALFALAHDQSPDVRKTVCLAFLVVLETVPAQMAPHLDGVVSYALLQMDSDEEVAMEACEFLLALAELASLENGVDRAKVAALLAKIVPVLLRTMVYLDEQIVLMEILDERDDAAAADRDEDIRPNMAKGKDTHTAGRKAAESDDDSDDEDELELWNLRRCSAATLDALSGIFPQNVIAEALPVLQNNIVSDDWPVREAAILAFGAVAAGCVDYASDKLPTLVPFLVDRMKDPQPRVRQISCWTLSRYAGWVAQEAGDGQYASYFQPTFEAVVLLTVDPKKAVQEAACSAVSLFLEAIDFSLIQYHVQPLLDHFAQCLALYQRKNLITLYDCVSTLVEKIGPQVAGEKPQYAQTLLPPLLDRWLRLEDTDTDLWPLFECLLTIAAAMETAFAPYALPVYERTLKVLAQAIEMNQSTHTDPEIEAPEKDFIVTALDLVDGLVQGLKLHFVELASHHNEHKLMPLVLTCLEDHDDDVRQLAYALVGDLAIFACHATCEPSLAQICVCIGNEINNYSYGSFPVTNNAVWALGEMALTLPKGALAQYLPNFVSLLIPLLNSQNTQLLVLENAAICLGRLGLDGASELAPRLPEFIYNWCTQMMYVLENDEKASAFMGMVQIVQANPDAGMGGLATQQGRKNLALFVNCIGNYFEPSQELMAAFHLVLAAYMQHMGGAWDSIMATLNPETRGFFSTNYGI